MHELHMCNIYTGRINKYLSVKFSTTSTHITCTFLDQQDTETVTELSCNIKYGQSQEQQNRVSYGYADVSSPSTVRIPLPFTLHGSYYYTVTASDGNFTVQLIGQDVLSKYTQCRSYNYNNIV